MRDLSVIVVSFNTAELLLKCLASVVTQTREPNYELIVVDNASSDDSVARVKQAFPDARVIVNEQNRGFSAACNQGLAVAAGTFVALLNSDAELINDAFGTMLSHLRERPRAGIVGPRLFNPDGSIQMSLATFPTLPELLLKWFYGEGRVSYGRHTYFDPDASEPERITEFCLTGACLVIRKDVFDEVGPLDEAYFLYIEDVDFTRLALAAGWELWLVPQARVLHHLNASVAKARSGPVEVAIKTGRVTSQRYYLEKHHSRLQARVFRTLIVPIFGLNLARRALAALVARGPRRAEPRFKLALAWQLLRAALGKTTDG